MGKSRTQLNREIVEALSRPLLKDDWPSAARRYVREAADWYAIDENLDEAVNSVIRKLERDQAGGVGDFTRESQPIKDSWYDRFESGEIDAEIRAAIQTSRRHASKI
jgi:hypothetical protein